MGCLRFVLQKHLFQVIGIALLMLVAAATEAKDMLLIGNSLTRHPVAPELGWAGNWGMAASSAENDYVHRTARQLERRQGPLEITIIPGYPLESQFLADRPPTMPAIASASYDYVVVEIGDNIDFRHPRANLFGQRYDALLSSLQNALRPDGHLACLGKWWPNAAADAIMRSSCEKHGGIFVPLAPISAKPENHAAMEQNFANHGVAEHPGDKGMAEIAAQLSCALSACPSSAANIENTNPPPDVGVYYYPGWNSQNRNWKDLKGLPDSRSPGRPWPEREPLLGYYAEEDRNIAEQHARWANQYGISFFAYDWYWDGKNTFFSHAIDNFIKISNNSLKFSILWANHGDVPRNLVEFDAMVEYWINHYLQRPDFYRIDGKPAIFIYSPGQLEVNASKFGTSASNLLARADQTVRRRGLPGLFLVAATNSRPDDAIEGALFKQGYSAYTGWNYVAAQDKRQSANYDSMVSTYLDFYKAAASTAGVLPYIVPASPGWDARPWESGKAFVRTDSTPEKFHTMLSGARTLLELRKPSIKNILMIEAWNEFGEGSYIEPTRKWQFEYLEQIKKFKR